MQGHDKTEPAVSNKPGQKTRWWFRWLLAAYGSFYVGLGLVVWLFGDRTWFGTVLLYAPRYHLVWPLLVPLVLIWFTRTWQRVVAIGIVLYGLFTVCGVCLPWESAGRSYFRDIRVLTLNANHFPTGTERFEQLVRDVNPDIVCLQWDGSIRPVQWPPEWSAHQSGELMIASRYPFTPTEIVHRRPNGKWPRIIAVFGTAHTPEGDLHFGTAHLMSPRLGLSGMLNSRTVLNLGKRKLITEEIKQRDNDSRNVAEAAARQGDELIMAADFNLPVESSIFRRHWGHWRDAFSRSGLGFGNTCFIRQGPLTLGARIDHVLYSSQWRCTKCWVGPDVGSDHLPLIADLQRVAGPR